MKRPLFLLLILCSLVVSCTRIEGSHQPTPTTVSVEVIGGRKTEVISYAVQTGDNLFGIADKFNLHPETILWTNIDLLANDPQRIRPGVVLIILPVNGVYYKWHKWDDLQTVAERFGVYPEDIVNWPGNRLDPASLERGTPLDIQPGTMLLIPGGRPEFLDSTPDIGQP